MNDPRILPQGDEAQRLLEQEIEEATDADEN